MRTLLKLSLSVLACLVLAACAGGATPSSTSGATSAAARSGGILRLAQAAGDIGTADPHYASSTPDRALVDMVFNGLIRYTPGDATTFEPDLATALPQTTTTSEGKQVWSFGLRKGVMCHASDGLLPYELTSDDVVYSLQKAANKATSAYASDYAGMTFGAPDPYQVTVTLDKPLSTALFYPRVANYAGGYILCRKAAEKLGPDGLKPPVGTGPFMFGTTCPRKVDLVANDAFSGQAATRRHRVSLHRGTE
jgi:peptide/nickel transport system substrate-binding protein